LTIQQGWFKSNQQIVLADEMKISLLILLGLTMAFMVQPGESGGPGGGSSVVQNHHKHHNQRKGGPKSNAILTVIAAKRNETL
jgi:hypothetical protein